jgi:hypothetical protein
MLATTIARVRAANEDKAAITAHRRVLRPLFDVICRQLDAQLEARFHAAISGPWYSWIGFIRIASNATPGIGAHLTRFTTTRPSPAGIKHHRTRRDAR